jgi:hypothetical protein
MRKWGEYSMIETAVTDLSGIMELEKRGCAFGEILPCIVGSRTREAGEKEI